MLAEAFPGYEAPIKPIQMAEYIFDFTTKYINDVQSFYRYIISVGTFTGKGRKKKF